MTDAKPETAAERNARETKEAQNAEAKNIKAAERKAELNSQQGLPAGEFDDSSFDETPAERQARIRARIAGVTGPATPPPQTLLASFRVTEITKSKGETKVVLTQQGFGRIAKERRFSQDDHAPTGTVTITVSAENEPRFQLNQLYQVEFAATQS